MEGKCKELEKKHFLNVSDKVNCESDLSLKLKVQNIQLLLMLNRLR